MSTATKERPILFSGPMVRAILAGKKTQTRRVVKPQPTCQWSVPPAVLFEGYLRRWGCGDDVNKIRCPYEVGLKLWVRETWLELDRHHWHTAGRREELVDFCGTPKINSVAYAADSGGSDSDRCRIELGYTRWRPSIHMPRWASRLTLEITDVRVQHVQEISEADAAAEGVEIVSIADAPRNAAWTFRQDFSRLWDSINSTRGFGWQANPWAWAISFKVVK